MSTLYTDGAGRAAQVGRWGTVTTLTFSGTSAQSSAFTRTFIARLGADEDCYVLISTNPTAAATTSVFLAAGVVEHIVIHSGDKIAAIQKSTGGTLTITEIA